MAFVTDAELTTALESALKVAAAALPSSWTEIIAESRDAAQNEVTGALVERGYTASQAAAWDRAKEFSRHIGLFWALTNGAGLHGNDPTFIEKFDRRLELATVTVLIDGEVPAEPESGGVGYGVLDTSSDRFTVDDEW